MTKSPEKKKPKRDVQSMTSDELMDYLFDPEVTEELKKVAHKARPKEKKPN